MGPGGAFAKWKRAAAGILNVLARPVRGRQAEDGLVLRTNRGYGSRAEVFLIGRVFRQSRRDVPARAESLADQLRDVRRRIMRRAVPGIAVLAEFHGARERVTTDADGYFRVHLRPRDVPPSDTLWHRMDLRLEDHPAVGAQGSIFIPPDRCRYVVISDIDDTIMETGVANKLKMLWRLFVEDAESRVPFPGVAALYRALHAGASGDQANPMLYVSRAPWGIYDVLDEFFARHGIPAGPVLFLREWGVSWRSPLPRKAEEHKRDLINNMLALYRDLPVVLIGDSGQHDPEIYRRVVDEHPGRVLAVYIRNVSREASRVGEIEELAKAVVAAGSSLVLAADSAAIADHAARLGLISAEAVPEVAADATRDVEKGAGEGVSGPVEPVAEADLHDVLVGRDGAQPPNVVVEPSPDRPPGAPGPTPTGTKLGLGH
jgi:phosphatidate phosphatase APP1